MSLVIVNNSEVNELISRGQRVVTFEMVATVHQVSVDTVRKSYQRNAEYFSEGKHTWVLESEELQILASSRTLSPTVPSLRVFTQVGYYMLVKPMRDRTSWNVQSEMAEVYFQVSQIASAPTQIETIQGIIQKHELLADFFGAPRSVMLVEAAKDLRTNGIETGQYLIESPEMDNIPDEDIYLEPTELGKHFGMSAQDMNLALSNMALQAKINNQWQATDRAQGMCINHQWTVGSKSGYNLKWNLAKVRGMMDQYLER